FLGGIPVIHALLTRRWRRFQEAPFWVSTMLFGTAVLALIRLSHMFHGTGVDQMSTSASDVYWILTRTYPAYFRWILGSLKGLPGIFGVCAITAYVWGRKRGLELPKLSLYFAWILSLSAVLTDLGAVSPRYLVFVFPAVLAIMYAWLFHGCRRIWS